MGREFEEVAGQFEAGGSRGGMTSAGRIGIDLADCGDEFVVTFEVPGFDNDEIDLRLAADTLQIAATHEEATEEGDETYIRSERRHRSMRERVRLPDPVREDGVEATLQNGVVTVRLPKADPREAGDHRIDIE